MPHPFPPPDTPYPVRGVDGALHFGTVYLSAVVTHPRFKVGDYTYASSFDPPESPEGWAGLLAPYLFTFSPEELVIGRFCQIADGVLFVTASANHRYDGLSTYPFAIFSARDDGVPRPSLPGPGPDTVIGHDVWIGKGATILPGARIGNGVIIGAGAVVAGPVPDYAVVAGNPARVLRMRFSPDEIARLLDLRWWDWPIEAIAAAEAEICGGDIAALAAKAPA